MPESTYLTVQLRIEASFIINRVCVMLLIKNVYQMNIHRQNKSIDRFFTTFLGFNIKKAMRAK